MLESTQEATWTMLGACVWIFELPGLYRETAVSLSGKVYVVIYSVTLLLCSAYSVSLHTFLCTVAAGMV